MPRLRTDDGPRKLRAVWLGPAGSTLPFQWTYVQWLVTLVAIPVGSTIGGALVWLTGAGLVWTVGIGMLWGGAAGVWAAVKLMGYVSYDEPLRYQRRLVRGEFSRRFSSAEEFQPVDVAFAFPPIGYLSAPVRRAIGWDTPDQRPLDAAGASAANPNRAPLPVGGHAEGLDRAPLPVGGRPENPDRAPLPVGGRPEDPDPALRPVGGRPENPDRALLPVGGRPENPDRAPLPVGGRPENPDRAPLPVGGRPENPDRAPLPVGGRPENPYLSIRPAAKASS